MKRRKNLKPRLRISISTEVEKGTRESKRIYYLPEDPEGKSSKGIKNI